jgi:hypothetical protein
MQIHVWKLIPLVTVKCHLILSVSHRHFASLLAGSRSSSPGKLLGSGLAGGSSRGPPVTPSSEKRSKIPRSQGCSRETSPNRIGLGKDLPDLKLHSQHGCHLGYDAITVWHGKQGSALELRKLLQLCLKLGSLCAYTDYTEISSESKTVELNASNDCGGTLSLAKH